MPQNPLQKSTTEGESKQTPLAPNGETITRSFQELNPSVQGSLGPLTFDLGVPTSQDGNLRLNSLRLALQKDHAGSALQQKNDAPLKSRNPLMAFSELGERAPLPSLLSNFMDTTGIESLDAYVSVLPNQERGLLKLHTQNADHQFKFGNFGGPESSSASYTLSGSQHLSELTSWLSNGEATLSSLSVVKDGKQLRFSPAITYDTPLGFSATVGGGVEQLYSHTYGLLPQYSTAFSGHPLSPSILETETDRVADSNFTLNTYRLPGSSAGTANGIMSTLNFFPEDGSRFSLLLGNDGRQNVVGLRSSKEFSLFGAPATVQGNGLYLQDLSTSQRQDTFAGQMTLERINNGSTMRLSVGGFGAEQEKNSAGGVFLQFDLTR